MPSRRCARWVPTDGLEPGSVHLREFTRGLADGVVQLVMPGRCAVCDAVGRGWLCPGCLQQCLLPPGPACGHCGAPWRAHVAGAGCGRCRRFGRPFSFQRAIGFWEYGAAVRRIVHRLKFNGRRDLAAPLGRLMAADPRIRTCLSLGPDALVVPLPARREARKRRGYDQALLLGQSLAHGLSLPCSSRALVRRRHGSRAQAGSSLAARRAQVRGVFSARHWLVAERPVILLDDVISTGASVDAAARALLLAGAQSVSVIALAT